MNTNLESFLSNGWEARFVGASPFAVSASTLIHVEPITGIEVYHGHGREGAPPWLLRFPGVIDVLIDPRANEVSIYRSNPEIDRSMLDHVIQDQLLPRVVGHFSNSLVLHAASVVVHGRCLVFCGRSGAGKSTLAGGLLRYGAALLSDDATALIATDGEILARGLCPSLRMNRDSLEVTGYRDTRDPADVEAGRKAQLANELLEVSEIAHPLTALFIIDEEPSHEIRFVEIGASSACMTLIESSFAITPTDIERVKLMFTLAAKVTNTAYIRQLSFPRDFARAADVRKALLEHLSLTQGVS